MKMKEEAKKESARPEAEAKEDAPVEKRAESAEKERTEKKPLRKDADTVTKQEAFWMFVRGLATGLFLVWMTQELSSWYFEPPKSAIVGLLIALICCLAQLLAAKPMVRFIVYYRFIAGAMHERHNQPEPWSAKLMHDIVVNGMSIVITLALLTLSRLFV